MSKRKLDETTTRVKRRKPSTFKLAPVSDDDDIGQEAAGESSSIATAAPGKASLRRPSPRPARGTVFKRDHDEPEAQAASTLVPHVAHDVDILPLELPIAANILRTEPKKHELFGPLEGKPKRPQGQSVAISTILPQLPQIQDGILATFAHRQLGLPCECKDAKAMFRCTECFNAPLWCRQCVVREHRFSPFHHIERWNGEFFVRDSLYQAEVNAKDTEIPGGGADGKPNQKPVDMEDAKTPRASGGKYQEPGLNFLLQTHVASRGLERCENAVPNQPDIRKFTIVDYNGIHTRDIEFCKCSRSDFLDWQQLLAVRLFPGSFKRPETAFSFTVMKQFHVHSLASKKSAYDYVKALCRLTNNVKPDSVTDRYREFLFACRLWRFLALQRRCGQAHGIDAHVPHRRANSLTLRCPACPEVGFNITAETMSAALATEQHKFTLYVSVDGNFKLQRKNKRDDPNDFALNDGNGYFVDSVDYKQYLKVAKPVEELGTCTHLRAARMQNMSKFKNAVVTGVVAVQCARHGFYLPQGMVDLSKGEAFANTDYAVAFSLGESKQLRWIRVIYDIWCHYGVKFARRIEEFFPSMKSIISKIEGAIPKMHILNHIERCQLEWNLNWLNYCAFTVGEMIETGWAAHNLTAGSTKEMNPGHRHDVIDDTSHHWNWEKMIALSSTLVRLYRIAMSERRTRTASFDNVDADLRKRRPEEVLKWEVEDVTPRKKNGKFYSVFQLNLKNGPPTHAKAYAKLLKAELTAQLTKAKGKKAARNKGESDSEVEVGSDSDGEEVPEGDADAGSESEAETEKAARTIEGCRKGDVALIGSGLLLERDREHVKRLVRISPEDIVRAGRRRLVTDITAFRSLQIRRVPELAKRMAEVDPEKPEDAPLFLPSHFTATQREAMKLEALAQVEYSLREGQAHDALADLRTAIRTRNYNVALKQKNVHGVGATTRAGDYLKTLNNDVALAGDAYRRTRAALVKLGLRNDDPTLKPLDPEKLEGKEGEGMKNGQAKKVDPWFWTTQRPAGMSDADEAEWEKEMDRVKWFRDRALRDRAIEEVETLKEEFRRAIEWFQRNSKIWEKMASTEGKQGEEFKGWRAYSYKQAEMFGKLAQECKADRERADRLAEKDRVTEETKAKAEAEAERLKAEEATLKEGTGYTANYSAYQPTADSTQGSLVRT